MAKIKIAVAGCLGRMGQEISKQILQNKNLEFRGFYFDLDIIFSFYKF